jgi:hypothetical protein
MIDDTLRHLSERLDTQPHQETAPTVALGERPKCPSCQGRRTLDDEARAWLDQNYVSALIRK